MTMRKIAIAAALALLAGSGPAGAPPARAQDAARGGEEDAWVPLFNGRNLSGWTNALGNGSSWKVRAGVLTGRGGGSEQPAVLVTGRQDYANYRLRVQFCYRRPGGGGIELRRSSPSRGVCTAYWVAAAVNPAPTALDRPAGNVARCKNYRYGRTTRPRAHRSAPVKADAKRWHTLECHVTGNTVTTYVDGQKADEFTDRRRPLPPGGIALFCRGDSTVQFREVSIQELPD